MTYGSELLELQRKVALKKQLEAKLTDLEDQQCIFDEKVIELRKQHRSEQKDVERLEGRSLFKYYYLAVGKLDVKLTDERKQAAAARVKLDAAERELAAVGCQIRDIQAQLSELDGCEIVYASALEKKYAEIRASGSPAGDRILKIEEKISFLESQKKEIREAAAAGRSALETADRILSELKGADGWNTWDMFGGGGIITHMAKHGHLDDAQNLVELLQGQLRKFKTELADINIQANMQVNIDGFLRFADYFFDGLFADWAVGKRINEALSSVMSVRRQIEAAMDKLSGLEQQADNKIAGLQDKIDNLVVKS